MKLLPVLLLGVFPAAYGYSCSALPPAVPGVHKDLLERFIVLPRPLRVGDNIVIYGKVGSGTVPFKRFSLDLFVDTNPIIYKTVSTLHMTAQYDLNRTFFGDYQVNANQLFRTDKIIPLAFNDNYFFLRITVEADGYSIYKDNVLLHKLKYFKENYSTVSTIYLQNLDFQTDCVIDCTEAKQCPATAAEEMTIIISHKTLQYVDGVCP
ncbi:unnamed protein product [Caenorhabditis auriculariae]|uniref:Galectin n=1 Tax=Caenorhabditis auriculariae TaxID=2777116 RepID=A0A8S1HIE7_9PELO|nr:unnamed protein product [Caenorhabditis auriculariae]